MRVTRRSNEQKGFVNFPVNDPKWKNSHEGGMSVQLVVEDADHKWGLCCGGYHNILYVETLVGDNHEYPPEPPEPLPENLDDWLAWDRRRPPYERHHFPHFVEYLEATQTDNDIYERLFSIPYLFTAVIGSTGWSGYDGENYWHCTYDDLTEDGKAMVALIEKLYPGYRWSLLSWLDT